MAFSITSILKSQVILGDALKRWGEEKRRLRLEAEEKRRYEAKTAEGKRQFTETLKLKKRRVTAYERYLDILSGLKKKVGTVKERLMAKKTVDSLVTEARGILLRGPKEEPHTRFKKIKKCSLFSVDDKIVNDPYDSGAFEDGVNIELHHVDHMDFIKEQSVYEEIIKGCFNSHGYN